jgi:hypothetical protein
MEDLMKSKQVEAQTKKEENKKPDPEIIFASRILDLMEST